MNKRVTTMSMTQKLAVDIPISTNPVLKQLVVFFMCMLCLTFIVSPAYANVIAAVSVATTTTTAQIYVNTTSNAVVNANITINGESKSVGPTSVSKSHILAISGLQSGQSYSYFVRAVNATDEQVTSAAVFYTKTQSGVLDFVPSKPIPAIWSGAPLSVHAKTTPQAVVSVYVDGMYRSTSSPADSFGNVSIPNIIFPLGKSTVNLTFEIYNEDFDPDTVYRSYQIAIDDSQPVLDLVDPTGILKQDGLTLYGYVNKFVTLESSVTYGSTGQIRTNTKQTFSAGNVSVTFALDEGRNSLYVKATDQAGNFVEYTKDVFVDSKNVQIIRTNLGEVSPTMKSVITVTGEVNKPNVEVRVYSMASSTLTNCNNVTYVNTAGKVADAACNVKVDKTNILTSDFPYVTTRSDANGKFSVDVALDPLLRFIDDLSVISDNSVVSGIGKDQSRNTNRVEAGLATQVPYKLGVVVIDNVGNTDLQSGEVRYQICGTNTYWSFFPSDVFPATIQPDLLMNGVAQISFKADIAYNGPGKPGTLAIDTPQIRLRSVSDGSLSISDAVGLTESNASNFDASLILRAESCKSYINAAGTMIYFTCPLSKYPRAQQNISKAYAQLDKISSVRLPLSVSFTYTYEADNGTIVSNNKYDQCIDAQIIMDKRVSPTTIPNGLLKGTVDIMDKTIKVINTILPTVRNLKLVTLFSCFGINVVQFFQFSKEAFYCKATLKSGMAAAAEQYLKGCETGNCDNFVNKYPIHKEAYESTFGQSCFDAIKSRLSTQIWSQRICDRIFCPNVPSAQQYIKNVNAKESTQKSSACSTLESNPYSGVVFSISSSEFNKNKGCGKEYNDAWASACLFYNPIQVSKDLAKKTDGSNIVQDSRNFLDNLNICSAKDQADSAPRKFATKNGPTYYQESADPKKPAESCFKLGTEITSANLQKDGVVDQKSVVQNIRPAVSADVTKQNGVNNCVQTASNNKLIYKFSDSDGNPIAYDSDIAGSQNFQPVTRAAVGSSAGKPDQVLLREFDGPPVVVDGKPTSSSSKLAIDPDGNYYTKEGTNWQEIKPGSKESEGIFRYPCDSQKSINGEPQYGVSTKIDNPECRTMNGPDDAGLKGQQVKSIIIKPAESFINSLRCVCLPTIEAYLQQIKNILTAIRNCFASVLYTGEYRAGACRALLTTYICDWIFTAIKCITRATGNLSGPDTERTQERGFSDVVKAMSDGASKLSDSVKNRYGDTASYQGLIASRQLINAVCLAAFGYDWLPELEGGINAGGNYAPIASEGAVVAATGRYLGSNPLNRGYATFNYEVGYFLVAGTNINWRLELQCSNDNSCSQAEGFAGGVCDCYYANGPSLGAPMKKTIAQGNAQGGQTIGDGDGKGQVFNSYNDPYRYDKVILTWSDPSKNNLSGRVEKKITTVGGVPTTCQFDLLTFTYGCEGAVADGQYGDVYFTGPGIQASKTEYYPGDEFAINVFANQDFVTIPPEKQIPKFARLRLMYQGTSVHSIASNRGDLSRQPITLRGYYFEKGQSAAGGVSYGTASTAPARVTSGEAIIGSGTFRATGELQTVSKDAKKVNYKDIGLIPVDAAKIRNEYVTTPQVMYLFAYVESSELKVDVFTDPQKTTTSSSVNLINSPGEVNLLEGMAKQTIIVPKSLYQTNSIPLLGINVPLTTMKDGPPITTSVQELYDSLRATPSNGAQKTARSIYLVFTSVGTSKLLCQVGSPDKIELTAEVTLHDGIAPKNVDGVTLENAEPSANVFKYQRLDQKKTIPITLVCRTTTGANSNNLAACPINSVVKYGDSRYLNSNNQFIGCSCNGQPLFASGETRDKMCFSEKEFDSSTIVDESQIKRLLEVNDAVATNILLERSSDSIKYSITVSGDLEQRSANLASSSYTICPITSSTTSLADAKVASSCLCTPDIFKFGDAVLCTDLTKRCAVNNGKGVCS